MQVRFIYLRAWCYAFILYNITSIAYNRRTDLLSFKYSSTSFSLSTSVKNTSKEEEEKKGEEKGDEEEEKDCLVVDKDGNCLVEEAGVIRVKRTQQAQETQEELALELAQDKKEEDKDSKL